MITRVTFLGSAFPSRISSLNLPEVNSFMGETTLGCLSRDFGDMTMHGFLNSQVSCLRRRWKKLEGSVILATTTLYSAESCKNLSGLALECSGPWPSYPWGRSITNPFIFCHFDSAEVINWSIMVWAPLAKSPNWASQTVRAWGLAMAYPYSNPKTAYSDSKEL